MGLFEPWLGNHNPSDQQLNEYIRRLKDALVNQAPFKAFSGTYEGDGTSSNAISIGDATLTPRLVMIHGYHSGGTSASYFTFGIEESIPDCIVYDTGAAPTQNSTAIKSVAEGEFVVGNTTYTNRNTAEYRYFVIAS